MAPDSRADLGSEQTTGRLAAVLFALGLFTGVVPYLGRAIGLRVDVASTVEVVDHVLPGALVATVGAYLFVLGRRGAAVGHWPTLLGTGACFLAGFWVFATHVPLLADAARGNVRWGAALWHTSTAVPIMIVSLWFVLRNPDGQRRNSR